MWVERLPNIHNYTLINDEPHLVIMHVIMINTKGKDSVDRRAGASNFCFGLIGESRPLAIGFVLCLMRVYHPGGPEVAGTQAGSTFSVSSRKCFTLVFLARESVPIGTDLC